MALLLFIAIIVNNYFSEYGEVGFPTTEIIPNSFAYFKDK